MNPYREPARRSGGRLPSWVMKIPMWSLRSMELVVTVALPVCLVISYGACVYSAVGCLTRTPADVAAESEYTAELLRCVDSAQTLAESKGCRQEVNRKWRITETLRDAGGE